MLCGEGAKSTGVAHSGKIYLLGGGYDLYTAAVWFFVPLIDVSLAKKCGNPCPHYTTGGNHTFSGDNLGLYRRLTFNTCRLVEHL